MNYKKNIKAADFITYDAKVPAKVKRVIKKLTTKDHKMFEWLKKLNKPDQEELIGLVFDDVNNFNKKQRTIIERLALKALCNGITSI